MRSSYLCNKNPCIDEMAYLYWNSHWPSFQLSPKPEFILVPTLSSCQLCHRWLPWMLSWQKPEVPLVFCDKGSLIAMLLGPTWGPSGADRTQLDPMLTPWTLLAGMSLGEFEAWCILYVYYLCTLSMFQLQYYISTNNRDIIETLATVSCKSDL